MSGSALGYEIVTASGSGVGSAGAIINTGAEQIDALRRVILAGDTTFGGTGRWDIRSTDDKRCHSRQPDTGGNAYKLTKTGTNQVSLVGVTVDAALGDVDVLEGTLGLELATTGLGNPANTLTVASGATLQLYALTLPLDKVLVLNGTGTNITLNNGGRREHPGRRGDA